MKHLIPGKDYLATFPEFALIGRDGDLNRLIAILVRSHANSVILSGSRGVGCESLCRGVQASKLDPNAPFDVVSKRMFWLDINGLFSSGDMADTNSKFQKIMRRMDRTTNAVMIIEDTRDFLEGARNSGCSHFVNSIISAVQHKTAQFILIAGDDDLEYVLKAHNDFRELFTVMTLDEPVGDTLLAIVTDATKQLTKHHGIKAAPEAIETAIALTNKYHTRDAGLSAAQPERSITLIDRAFSSYKLSSHKAPPAGLSPQDWAQYQSMLRECYQNQRDGEDYIVGLEEEIVDLKEAKKDGTEEISTSDNAFDRLTAAGGMEGADISDRRKKIATAQKEVDANKKRFDSITETLNEKLKLGKDDIVREFSDISGIAASKLTQNDLEKLKNLEANLKKRIYGQDFAMESLANAVKVGRVGRRGNGEPQAAFLFLGSSGTGKSETAKALSAVLLDDERALTRFDMSEFMEKHAVAKMIGAPPGYEGYEAGGILTNLMRKNGNRVLLFDEIEKAHPDLFNIFLQILSDGRLTDNVGRTVSFEDSVIVMTSNIGQIYFLDPTMVPAEARELAIALLTKPKPEGAEFKNEFLNRFAGRQNIICFNRLELDSIQKIVAREIGKMDAAYAERGLRVTISEESLVSFCAALYDPTIGARGLPGYIKANIEPVIVDKMINSPDVRGVFEIVYTDKLEMRFSS
jgi:ATP-dependent Clp protease ATP-binding subunit ClpB